MIVLSIMVVLSGGGWWCLAGSFASLAAGEGSEVFVV
jgi:hypothetical protein